MSTETLTNRTITAVPDVEVGHYNDPEYATGTTVISFPKRARSAYSVFGQVPATRHLGALSDHHTSEECDAFCLTGGSSFGLAAVDGVMAFLEARGRGTADSDDSEHPFRSNPNRHSCRWRMKRVFIRRARDGG